MMKLNILNPTDIEKKLNQYQLNNNFLKSELALKIDDFDVNKLDTDKIYHIENIKSLCIDYRLRFLDLKYFKGEIPDEGIKKINSFKASHGSLISNFKIMAPSKMFRLKNYDDPLLFINLGNNYFYLIHKWGNDLSPFRKLLMWPFKNILNLIVFMIILSLFLTEITPAGLFSKSASVSSFFMIFFFMFKAVASIFIFYGFSLGKNFNKYIWNNKYDKSQ